MPARKGLRFPSLPITLEMTAQQVADWAEEYGLDDGEMTPGQLLDVVRDDVAQYLLTLVQDCSAADCWTATARPRVTRTERAGYSPVTADMAAAIKARRGTPVREISEELRVPKSTVALVLAEDEERDRKRQGYTV